MFRIDPRDESDLMWFWNDAPTEVGRMRSLQSSFEAQMERKARRKGQRPRIVYKRAVDGPGYITAWQDDGLRCGPVYVGAGDEHQEPVTELDGRAIAAAARERRIREALTAAGEDAAHVLRLYYREVLPMHRVPFGCVGVGAGASRGRPMDKATGTAPTLLRGAGNLAHLTSTALELYPVDTAARVDALGKRLLAAPLPWERDRGEQLRREANELVLAAYREYRGEVVEQIARRAA